MDLLCRVLECSFGLCMLCMLLINNCTQSLHSHTSHIVSRGGFLFEWYMTTCASYTQFRKWRASAQAARSAGEEIPHQEQADFIAANQHTFTGWLLFHVANTGSNGRRQTFYLTFLMQYHGLSREGIDVCADMGYCQRIRTFDDSRNDAMILHEDRRRYVDRR